MIAALGRELEIQKLLPTDNNPDLALAAKELSRRAVLIVLQHYEAFDTPTIFNWLKSLHHSKAVVISCQSPQKHQVDWSRAVWVPKMTSSERAEFLKLCLDADNSNPFTLSESDEQVLFDVTGANPLRIAKAISLLRRGWNLRDLQSPTFINKIVPASFSSFGVHSRHCLLALSLFPYGAYSKEITEITQLNEDEIEAALSPLGGFVEVCHGPTMSDESRWRLADAGTGYWLREHHKGDPELEAMKNRWYSYFEKLAGNIGCCWDDLEKLQALDVPGRAETVVHVLRQAMIEKRYDSAIRIGRGCRYWQYVRGDWLGEVSPIQTWENAARACDNKAELFDALVYKLNIRSKQAMHSDAALKNANALAKEVKALSNSTQLSKVSKDRYFHAISLWEMASGQLESAEKRWKANLRKRMNPHEKSAMQRWLAVCLRQQKNAKKRNEARKILSQHLKYVDGKFERSALMAHLNLAEMDLDDKNVELAGSRLERIKKRITDSRDYSFLADHDFFTAKFLLASNKPDIAVTTFERARKSYDLLGEDARVSEIDKTLSKLG
jgi:hypothetical protein